MDTQTHFFLPSDDRLEFLFIFLWQGFLRHTETIINLIQQQTAKINRQGTEQYKYNIFSGINKIEQITEYQQNLPLVL